MVDAEAVPDGAVGALPAPVQIIEERTVGPSLGAASIKAGTISVLIVQEAALGVSLSSIAVFPVLIAALHDRVEGTDAADHLHTRRIDRRRH